MNHYVIKRYKTFLHIFMGCINHAFECIAVLTFKFVKLKMVALVGIKITITAIYSCL